MLRRHFISAPAIAAGFFLPRVAHASPQPTACNILDFGAKPDGKTLNSVAIQRVIDRVSASGGGVVYVPPGVFHVGALELKSYVTLYLEAGAVLLGSTSIQDYRHFSGPKQWGDANGRHLLFARGAEDISVCGTGGIDGQGPAYWRNVHRAPVRPEDMWRDVATFDYLPIDNHRPSPMLEFVECKNVCVSGVTLKNAPGWTLRPVACEGVVIDGIRIRNPRIGPNTDGLDITASRNVFVSNCDIDTGDDAICIKSENPYGKTLPTKNITVTNCVLTTACNGFKLGTASKGAFENIVFSNSVIYSENTSPLNAHVIGGVNVEVVDGGSADGIVVSNIRMQNVRTPIFLRLGKRTRGAETVLRNVSIQGIDAAGAVVTSSIVGVPELRVSDVSIADCRIRTVEGGQQAWTQRRIPECEEDYPEARMFGRLPAAGIYIRHADHIRLRNLEVIADAPDTRPAVVCDDVEDVSISGLETRGLSAASSQVELRDTRNGFVTASRAPLQSKVFVAVKGARSSQTVLTGNAVSPMQQMVCYSDGASEP